MQDQIVVVLQSAWRQDNALAIYLISNGWLMGPGEIVLCISHSLIALFTVIINMGVTGLFYSNFFSNTKIQMKGNSVISFISLVCDFLLLN